jgi:hypothetical protein
VLGGLLNPAGGIDPTGGLDLDSPLGGDLVDVKPGQNSPDPTGAADNALPAADGRPAARTGLGDQHTNREPANSTLSDDAAQRALPAADVVGEALPAPGGLPTLGTLPVGNLLGGGLPLIGGLMPDGRTPSTLPAQESGLLGEGLPLLGGLGGLLPADSAPTLPALDETPDTSGMPAGGTPVPADDTTTPVADTPATPADADPGDDDKRLHEEPIDDEAKQSKRSFSDGRPVAGEDTEYK